MVPKGLLTFLGGLYKEVAKATSGTFVYIASRDKPPDFLLLLSFLRKALCPRLGTQDFCLRNLQRAAFSILMSYFMESKLKKISIDSW